MKNASGVAPAFYRLGSGVTRPLLIRPRHPRAIVLNVGLDSYQIPIPIALHECEDSRRLRSAVVPSLIYDHTGIS